MENSIVYVRNVLFKQLERLNAENCDIDKEYLRAEAMQMVATPIISSAKIEADLISRSGGKYSGTGFIDSPKQLPEGGQS